MKVNKGKRLLSLLLSLIMILSWNVPVNAEDVVPCPDGQHEFTMLREVIKEPTCSQTGDATFQCAKCGYFDEMSNDCYGKIPMLEHEYQEVRVEPTCQMEGSVSRVCVICEHEAEKEILPKVSHKYSTELSEVSAATCTEPKKLGYQCVYEGCNEVNPEEALVPDGEPLGHDFSDETKTRVMKEATCTKGQMVALVCTRPGCDEAQPEADWKEVGEPLADGHNYEGAELEVIEPATCVKPAKLGRKCVICGTVDEASIVDSEDGPDPEAHDFENSEEYEVVTPADCSHYAKVKKKCANGCGTLSDVEEEDVEGGFDAEVHHYKDAEEEIEPATCTKYAVWGIKCQDCGAVKPGSEHENTEGQLAEHQFADDADTREVPATCMTPGYTEKQCSVCEAYVKVEGSETALDPTNHEYVTTGEKTFEVSKADCQHGARMAYPCKNPNCENVYDPDSVEEVGQPDPTNHLWGDPVRVAPTCTENAKEVKTCTVHPAAKQEVDLYEESKDDKDKALGHHYVTVPGKEPTCQDAGLTEGSQCDRCDAWEKEQTEIPADPSKHVFTAATTTIIRQPSCAKPGLTKGTCSVCGKSAYRSLPAGHVYPEVGEGTPVPGNAATCLKPGQETVTCIRYSEEGENHCDLDDAERTIVRDVPIQDHTWVLDKEASKPADCGGGLDVYVCSVCGDRKEEATDPVGEHNFEVRIKKACGDGAPRKGEYCTVCDQLKPGTQETPLGIDDPDFSANHQDDHTYVVDEEKSIPATCTEDGTKVSVCSFCGDVKTETVKAAHDFDEATLEEKWDNCLEPGYWTAYCKRCEETIRITDSEVNGVELTPVYAKTSHVGSEAVAAEEATCQKPGHTAGKYCAFCDTYYDGYEETPVDPENHDYEVTVLRPANCVTGENGIGKYVCKNEGCTSSKYDIIEFAHNFIGGDLEVTKEPTCTEKGEGVRHCAVAGCTATELEEIPLRGHTMQPVPEESKAPTCGKPGLNVEQCSRCDYKTETPVPATGDHPEVGGTYGLQPATCTEPATAGLICPDCGCLIGEGIVFTNENKQAIYAAFMEQTGCSESSEEFTNFVAEVETWEAEAALGHQTPLKEIVVVPATCTEDGISDFSCERCGVVVESNVKIQASHKLGKETLVDPTCLEAGKTVRYCENCDYVEIVKDLSDLEDMKPLPHKYELVEDGTFREATCTVNGFGKYHCVNGCDEVRYDVIPASHTYDEGVVVTPATCDKAGEMLYTCTVCDEATEGHTKTEVIPALGHNFQGSMDVIPATCTESAKIGAECSRCHIGAPGTVTITEDTTDAEIAELREDIRAQWDDPSDPVKLAELDAKLAAMSRVPLGHTWGQDDDPQGTPIKTVSAKCEEEGTKTYQCDRCKELLDKAIPALGHNWEEEYIAPTCMSPGRIRYTCLNNCGTKKDDLVLTEEDPALPHTWDEGERLPKEGVDTAGMTPEEIARLICAEGGRLVKHCTTEGCTATDVTEIEPGHQFRAKIYEKEGERVAIIPECIHCGFEDTENPIYMLSGWAFCPEHKMVQITEADILPAKAATCTETGLSEGRRCPLCPEDAEPVQPQKVIPALGHTGGELVVVEPATCAEDGYKARTCTREIDGKVCGEEYDVEVIPATGEHVYVETYTPPTCQEYGKLEFICSGCHQPDPDREPVIDAEYGPHKFGEDQICEVCGKSSITAVTKAEAIETEDGTRKVKFTSDVSVPEEFKQNIVEMGFLYVTATSYDASSVKEDLTVALDENGAFVVQSPVKAKQYKSSVLGDLSVYSGAVLNINLGKTEANVDRKMYARGYVIVKIGDKYQIYYDDVLSGSYNDFKSSAN